MPVRLSGATRAVAVLTAATLVVAGNAASANGAARRERATLQVHATSNHHVSAPSSLRPGLVHLINTSRPELVLVRKKHKGAPGFVADYNNATNTAGSIKFYRDFDVVDLIASHADEFIRFTKGTYYLADSSTSTLTVARVRTVSVSGKTANATAPRSTLVQTAANGHLAGPVTMGKRAYAHVVNKTAAPHIVSIESIRSGVTNRQINAAIADPVHHDPTKLAGNYFAPLGLIAGHTDIYKRMTASARRYFLFTASLTHPGLAKGQVGLLTVK